jgi:sugar transferase (PEP-CTERM/EpsH1 system associated)
VNVLPRPRILSLVHRTPYPPDKGDRIRAYHLLRFLARHASVHLATLADEPVDAATHAALQECCERVEVIPVGRRTRWLWALASLARGRTVTEGAFSSPPLRALIRSWARETHYHACLTSASSLAPYLYLPELRDVPAVVDLVDCDSQKWLDYAAASRGPMAWLYRTEGRRLRRLEQELPARAGALTVVSDAEAEICRRFAPDSPIHVVRNGVDLAYFQPVECPRELACVFVGALDYRPNVDGACWFCDEVWPALHAKRPEAKLYLVGRRPAPAVRRLAGRPGVELVGQVPDVRPYLARAAVSVVPLRLARGVQNKVLEALAMARPTVASPPALAGLRAKPGTHLLSAVTPAEWVAAVLRLLDDDALARQLGAAGRRYTEEHHCWERCLEPFRSLLSLPL